MRGSFAVAERHTAQAAEQSRGLQGSLAPIIADGQTFVLRRTQGRHLDLEPLLRRHADRLPHMRGWRCALALVLAELGRTDEARKELEQLAADDFGVLARDATWLFAASMLAELCALLRDDRRARAACTSCSRRSRGATRSRWAPPTSGRSRAISGCSR